MEMLPNKSLIMGGSCVAANEFNRYAIIAQEA